MGDVTCVCRACRVWFWTTNRHPTMMVKSSLPVVLCFLFLPNNDSFSFTTVSLTSFQKDRFRYSKCCVRNHQRHASGVDTASPGLSPPQIRSLPSEERFQYRLEQLKQYYEENGHFDVPRKYDQGLSNWVGTQRAEYKRWLRNRKSLLTKSRIELLNQIGFDWNVDSGDKLQRQWMENYRKLTEFRKDHGHVLVPREQRKLWSWCENQRTQYKRYKRRLIPCSMTPERIELLNRLDMIWSPRDAGSTAFDERWMKRYEELKSYRKAHGHCRVSREDGPLGRWVSNQRQAYKDRLQYKVSSMTSHREELLRMLGFEFEPKEGRPVNAKINRGINE